MINLNCDPLMPADPANAAGMSNTAGPRQQMGNCDCFNVRGPRSGGNSGNSDNGGDASATDAAPTLHYGQHRSFMSHRRHLDGMTVVEAVLGTVIALIVLGSFYLVFSRSVGSSMQGEDVLTSLQDASIILEDIRREVMMASRIASPAELITSGVDEIPLNNGSTTLVILGGHGTIHYRFVAQGTSGYLEKSSRNGDQILSSKRLAYPRLKEFSVWWIKQRQTSGANIFHSRVLCIILNVQGDKPGQSGRAIRMQTLIAPPFTAKEHSTWPG